MEHTPSVEEMIAIIQEYIKDRTGKNVHIVFNDLFRVRKHMIMLNEAYNYVVNYRNTK